MEYSENLMRKNEKQALLLISALTNESIRACGSGSMSPSIYDTAWVSMVSKTTTDGITWVFPESFQYILDTQMPDGGWESYSSQVDGILNTAASLMALIKHASARFHRHPSIVPTDIDSRISSAKGSLSSQLCVWDIKSCNHVGFEILVPALVVMLENEGVELEFPSKQNLMEINREKLHKFRPEWIYASPQTSLHSLEAFVGKIDFDRVSHHKTNGSLMGSPASTAVYLMNTTVWDFESECYLRNVISEGTGDGNGSVPCAFPTTLFELTWVVSTLLNAGFTRLMLGEYNLEIIQHILEKSLLEQNGVIGFAPLMLADADDSAKAIFTLSLLGKLYDPGQMIANFGLATHFQTYYNERTASFSTNCNVLGALLHASEPSRYMDQISTTVHYLCDSWAAGKLDDKWNLSAHYSMMLLAQTFRRLLILWDEGLLAELDNRMLRERVALTLLQIYHRTLYWQSSNGSWGIENDCEATAYALLTLVELFDLPWFQSLNPTLELAIHAGRQFLELSRPVWGRPSYKWIEKVTYSSDVLSTTYCLAASNSAACFRETQCRCWKPSTKQVIDIPEDKLVNFCSIFSRIPLFMGRPTWQLNASIIEAYIFLPYLHRDRLAIFPRLNMARDDYLEYIPITWTTCNNMGIFLEADLLQDMMKISMLNYQADEFMESVVETVFSTDLVQAKDTIMTFLSALNKKDLKNAVVLENDNDKYPSSLLSEILPGDNSSTEKKSALRPLEDFVRFVYKHQTIQNAPASSLRDLHMRLSEFLFAHLEQCAENAKFMQQLKKSESDTFQTSLPYWDWIRTISAPHTSCLYSWEWIQCRVSSEQNEVFPTSLTRYLSLELGSHLAAMCRMYNDYGSVARDREEGNVNSINFAEFDTIRSTSPQYLGVSQKQLLSDDRIGATKKAELLELARYEQSRVVDVQKRLDPFVNARTRRVMKLFVDVTDLYGQIYMVRDIASRVK